MIRLFTIREYKNGPLVQPVTYFENKKDAKNTRIGGQVVSFGPDHKKVTGVIRLTTEVLVVAVANTP